MINDFPWGSTTIRFPSFIFSKEMLTSFLCDMKKAQTTSKKKIKLNLKLNIERLNPYKFNIYESKHISIQLPEL